MQKTTSNLASSTTTGSIDLAAIGHPVSVVLNTTPDPKSKKTDIATAIDTATAKVITPQDELKSLELSRISWETTELAASNRRLYAILTQAYTFYLVMKTDSDKAVRLQHADALKAFIDERNYVFSPSSHDMTRVVKCVFGVDRRRVSAYSIALREALRQGTAAENLIGFLETNGGVEQIRMGGTKPFTVTERAMLAEDEVLANCIGKVKFDPLLIDADPDWIDTQVVIIATYLPTGEFEANAVVRHNGAVNSALAAYYSNQQRKQREAEKAEREAIKEAEEAEAANNKKASKSKDDAMEKQKAKVVAEVAEAKRIAANAEIFEGLFTADAI